MIESFQQATTGEAETLQREIAHIREKIHGAWKALASERLDANERRLLRDHLSISQGRLKLLLSRHPARQPGAPRDMGQLGYNPIDSMKLDSVYSDSPVAFASWLSWKKSR